jgi:protein SCO1/2
MKVVLSKAWIVAALVLSACAPKTAFNGVDITGADYAKDFSLKDSNGQTLTIDAFNGQVVALFFGYTQCPDVCPTTMSEFKQIKDSLGERGSKLQVVFVSVDPQRDTPELLRAYTDNFDSSFKGYSPSPEELERIAKSFKIYYKKVPNNSSNSESYTVDHSAGTYLFDTHGQLRLFERFGMPVPQLTQDITTLLGT